MEVKEMKCIDQEEEEEKSSRFRRICVYCGSAKGRKSSYQEAAIELGKELVMLY